MDFIQIGLEDESNPPQSGEDVQLQPNETEQAAEAMQNLESTEPEKQIQVANYKEELAILQQQKANEQEEDPDASQDNPPAEGGEGGNENEPPENNENEEPTETPAEGEEEGDDNEGDDESSEEDTEPVNTDAEMGADGVDKPAEQVAQEQYIVQGQRMVSQALESVYVMGKYHNFLSKRCELGGINPHTAKVITNAFEHYAAQAGYNFAQPMPALESFGTYSGAANSSMELKIGIEGFLNDVWTAIKKFFKSIWTWLMDMLTPKKVESAGSPADRAARDKAVKALEAENAKLIKQLERVNAAREKDAAGKEEREQERLRREGREATARLNQKIAAQLFKTSDKGSFTEISLNARQLAEVVQFAAKYSQMLAKLINLAGAGALSGKQIPVGDLAISKNAIGGLTFNEVSRGNKSAVYVAATDEILGGLGTRFIFGGTDVTAIAKTIGAPKVIQELAQQGFKMTSVKDKSGFPTRLPELDSSERAALHSVVVEVSSAFKGVTVIQETASKLAKVIKDASEASEPASWQGLDKQSIAVLQMQLNFVGLLETNLVAGYKSMSDQVNNFKNAYMRLAAMYITE